MRSSSLKAKMFVWVWLVGFSFGFDFGIIGGLLSSSLFLKDFFPNAYKNMISNDPDSLCCVLFGDFAVNLLRSCLYLVAFISSSTVTIFTVHTYIKIGIGGALMSISTFFGVLAMNIEVIASCRMLFAMGIGITIQVVATHASEMAPCTYRRRVMTLFPQAIAFGILAANLSFYVVRITYSINGRTMALGSFLSVFLVSIHTACLTSCRSYLLKCLFDDSSKAVDSSGTTDYEAERYLIQQVQVSPSSIVFKRKYIPLLVMTVCMSVFQQLTGVYAFMLYAPVLFKTIGLGEGASLLCSSAMYGANLIVTYASTATIGKFRRRSSFMLGGIAMLLCQVIITSILRFHENNLGLMPKWNAILLVVTMSTYVAGFAWSWGPLGWVVPCEILPLKIQSIGYSLFVSTNMICMFLVTQFFMTGLCEMRLAMHLVILSSVLLMTIFVHVFLPETKNVEVDNMSEIWTTHWFWKKFIEEEDKIGVRFVSELI